MRAAADYITAHRTRIYCTDTSVCLATATAAGHSAASRQANQSRAGFSDQELLLGHVLPSGLTFDR